MLTKQEVLEIISYCQEHGISRKERLIQLGIGEWAFYSAKKKYLEQEATKPVAQGEFVQLASTGAFVPSSVTEMEKTVNPGRTPKQGPEKEIDVECRTVRGGMIRFHGALSAVQLAVIIQNL